MSGVLHTTTFMATTTPISSQTQPTYKSGQAGSGRGINATVPNHASGDLIIVVASTQSPRVMTAPTPGGTVPTWNIFTSSAGGGMSMVVAWAAATLSNHSTGTWGNTNSSLNRHMIAVFSGASTSTPIGSFNIGFSAASTPVAPGINLTNGSGTSVVSHVFASSSATWSGIPSGYTERLRLNGIGNLYLTKDVTTSAPQLSIAPSTTWTAASFEILPA